MNLIGFVFQLVSILFRHESVITQNLQTVNIIFLDLINDPEIVSEFPVTPGFASTEFASHFIRNYNSFPGYEIKTFYRAVAVGPRRHEKGVSALFSFNI